mgnify:CR=1 FL=1
MQDSITEPFIRSGAAFLRFDHYAVIGAGLSGRAAGRLLLDLGKAVTLYDDHADAEDAAYTELVERGASLQFGTNPSSLGAAQAVVASPGVPPSHPLLATATEAGVPLRSELELGWWCSGGARTIAVTGTNGKTTVTLLIAHMLNQLGEPAAVAGNVGTAFCDQVRAYRDRLDQSTFVVEVSSFQLETIEAFTPDIAVVLNVTPDHLDRHASMEAYAGAKARLTRRQTERQWLVSNQDCSFCLAIEARTRARTKRFSLKRPVSEGVWLDGDLLVEEQPGKRSHAIVAMDQLPTLGLHNVANAMAAICVGRILNFGRRDIETALQDFQSAPHRMELVARHQGIQFVNDSKATNLDAMVKAVESFEAGIHLIAGGRDKNSPFDQVQSLLTPRVKTAYLIGEAAGPMEQAWSGQIDCVQCGNLCQALDRAASRSEEGDTILLSPGCASFDQFTSYVHRGETFRQWVQTHVAEGARSE